MDNRKERALVSEARPLGATYGKILHVDLRTGAFQVEIPPKEVYRKLLGGRALIAFILLRDLPAGVDPLGPENLLIFAPGLLQGTHLPGSGRHAVGAKSPLTGGLGSSEVGGWWGHEFKRTGYDAMVIQGRAEQPVYLWIQNEKVNILPAGHLWGKETGQVEPLIREELGDKLIRIAQIGIAGENLVRFSSIMHDINRAAGRGGMGAVMGSKNLKAVAVRGTKSLQVADRKRIVQVAKWLGANYREKAGWAVEMGTPKGLVNMESMGILPTRNFQDHQFRDAAQIGGQRMHATILKERDTCMACPIRCKQVVEYQDPEGRYNIDPIYGGPEYETLSALGSNCYVGNLPAVAKANERCAAYGLDTISTGGTIAFVMECVQRELLTADDTGGYLPQWGDPEAVLEGIELIATRQGFGDRMANGVKQLAEEIGKGAEEFALHARGLEVAMHEPRFKPSLLIGYATSPWGGDHITSVQDSDYSYPGDNVERVNAVYKIKPLERHDMGEDKMHLIYYETNWHHFLDCAVMCYFHPYRYEHMAEALSGATGTEYSIHDVLAVGERANTLGRLFNYREGFTRADDKVPRRFMKAFEEGPITGEALSPEMFERVLRRYYELMGWDKDTGYPTPERLGTLGLSELLADISMTKST
jgi:aldehyde:ferredoxin oxidoreductase